MTGQNNDIQWYIAREGKQHGPLSEIEMRTFVAHSYLRPTDLIWRPGMADWQPAPSVFPAIFQPQSQNPDAAAAPSAGAQSSLPQARGASGQDSDFESDLDSEQTPKRLLVRQLALAAVVIAVIGGGALGLTLYGEPLLRLIPNQSKPAVAAAKSDGRAATAATDKPAETQEEVAVAAPPQSPPAPGEVVSTASIDGSQIDARLQKIPVWGLIKKEYPGWYVNNIAAAEKLAAEKKPDIEIASQLAQGLVTLRRQNADKALAASPDTLKRIAGAFLENLRALRAISVGACYGFISKGEASPAVVELLQAPENATAFNNQASAIFEAAVEGSKTPAKHEAAEKADYELLIKELGKIGWKDEDLQVFSNPRLLAKREPAQVCQMVQDWFVAHLSIQDAGALERLLYETLKPVVQG